MDNRSLAHIERIKDLTPIEGADKIEVAHVLGWECVVKKGEFSVGDLVVYVEIDSKCPPADWSSFLEPRGYKVKTIKLKGQVSQGLVLPVSVLGAKKYKEGQDVTKALGIKKIVQSRTRYKYLEPKSKFLKWLFKHQWAFFLKKYFLTASQVNFPGWIPKTDVERLQNLRDGVPDIKERTIITEKIDGQSCTLYKHRNKYGVCSRSLELLVEQGSWWSIAKEINYKDRLDSLESSTSCFIQGEIIGPGIQSNRYNRDCYEFYVFNVVVDNKPLSYDSMVQWCESQGLKYVPWVDIINSNAIGDISQWVEYSRGYSKLNKSTIREGVVVRMGDKYNSFKVINPDYLLKFDPEDEDM